MRRAPGGGSWRPARRVGATFALAGCIAAGASQQPLVPPGYGTLRQDDFTVALRSGPLLVKVTPLAESVIRLAAPDTYTRLHALAQRWSGAARREAFSEDPPLFLVSFYSYAPDVPFQPEDLQLTHQGRLLRPAAIFPLTPGWGQQRLEQQQLQSAIYVFGSDFNYELPIVVRYGVEQSDGWGRIIPTLQTERGKVRARAASGEGGTGAARGGATSTGAVPITPGSRTP